MMMESIPSNEGAFAEVRNTRNPLESVHEINHMRDEDMQDDYWGNAAAEVPNSVNEAPKIEYNLSNNCGEEFF